MKINFSKIKDSRIYAFFIVLTLIIYGNAINNEYSLDDNIIVDREDSIVERGLKATGIIFKSRYAKDKEQSYDYRPITTLSFAVEKQFFRKLPKFQTKEEKEKKDRLTQANISHFINILLYIFSCIILYQVLCNLFDKYNILLPLLITFLFIIHPLHTEVVVNIKSRDEILMFMFMLLAIKQYLNFEYLKKIKYIFYTLLFITLSILSKKDGLAVVAILPVVIYYKKINLKRIIYPLILFVVAFIVIKFLKRLLTVEEIRDIKYFENPLLYSDNFMDRITVGFYCSWFYLKMLIFPLDLSYYYGYNQIPMATWKNWEVWASILFYVPLGFYGFLQFIKRKVIGLGIILWLGLMLAVINVLFPIVGIVADRFTYMFSLGFCIVAGYLLLKLFKVDLSRDNLNINLPSSFISVFLIISIAYAGRTISRNPDWHDYLTLYETDIENVPNSAKAHALISNSIYPRIAAMKRVNPGNPEIKKDIDKVIYHYHECIKIYPDYIVSLNNLGSAYIDFKGDSETGLKYCKKALELRPDYEEALLNIATAYTRLNKKDSAFYYFVKTIEVNPENFKAYDGFGKFLVQNGLVEKGKERLLKLAETSENPKYIYSNLANLTSLDDSQLSLTTYYFEMAFSYDTTDKRLCTHLIKLYTMLGNSEKVSYYNKICNSIN